MPLPAVLPVTIDAWVADPPPVFDWPAPFSDIVAPMADFYRRYLDDVIAQDDADLRAVLLLGRRPMQLLALIQFSLWTEAARQHGQRMVGHDILDYLAGTGDRPTVALQVMALPVVRARFLGLRRLARTASWTPAWRLARAALRPDGVALTHNSLLRNYLRHSSHAVRNAYDEDFALNSGLIDEKFTRRMEAPALAGHMVNTLIDELPLSDDIRARLADCMRPVLTESFRDSIDLLGRLRMVRKLPHRLFTGNGGKRMSRALGLEIIRRGGDVTRCDHGGSFLLLHNPEFMALNELAVSTRFVVTTPLAAQSADVLAGKERAAPLSSCAIVGSRGDPGLDVGSAAFARTSSAANRRRAMYVPSIFYGLNQVSPPVLPGSLYLEWQRRLMALLKDMPVEVLWKAHPAGHKPPATLNPARDARIIAARFEQAVAEADILIYDFPATTTLAVGLCTDRPIVLIDHGTMRFNASLRSEIAARCRTVACTYDDRNLPTVSREALEGAICGGPPTADPTYFRRLFLGDERSGSAA